MSERGATPHPDWYDGTVDFSHPRYAFALRVGANAAIVSTQGWDRVERILGGSWVVLPDGLAWTDARMAVYHGWITAKATRSR